MKNRNKKMNVRILTLAVQSVLMVAITLPLSVYAADDEADFLKKPNNFVDFGFLYSSQDSARFGQYNGLNKDGFYGIGGFDVRGGEGYDQDKDSALRWNLNAANLGTTSRNLGASISDQGKWKIKAGYDELQHNITNTFQTPFQGSAGDNNFTLPANFGKTTNTRTLTPAQLSDFHTEKEYVNRKNASVAASYFFSPQLSVQIDYNHLNQTGAKLIGTGSQGGITGTGAAGSGQAVNILMNPTQYSTDNITAALNWVGENAYLTAGYYGSLFHDDYNSLSWQNAINIGGKSIYENNTMSTAPSNSFHQANLTGGYNFSTSTKLAGGFSYGYNKQNSSFAPTNIVQPNGTSANMMQANGLPATSLNGVVETIHGDIKLTNQSIKDLSLSAGFKFDERDNNTDSNIYKYLNITNAAFTGVNTPYSNRKMQYEAIADYRLTKGQNLNLTYGHESIKRWCNGVVGGAQCVANPSSEEDKISLTYRLKAIEGVNFNAGYSYSNRRADSSNFLANAGNYAVTTSGGANTALNAGNYLGYIAAPYANRNQNLGKAGVTWQVTQNFDVGVNGRYSYDDYNAQLGIQNGKSASVNVDATYSYSDNGSVSAYWSWQNGQRNIRSGQNGTPSGGTTNIWTNKLNDNSNAVGLLAKQTGLLDGKLDIIGDMSYSLDTSTYSTQVPYLTTCGASTTLTCGSLSPIKNEVISLKLTGNYKVVKNGTISLSYLYQKLNSNDYFYNGQQIGYTPTALMPTGLQQQSYTVNVVALSYMYNF